MATEIIGSAINTKVLKRQNFNKEPNGLETLIEAYAIKTSNRVSVVPEKNTLHTAFSSASTKYSRMAVESVTTEEEDGGITSMLVTFVGLTSSTGLPPAIVRLIPTAGEGVYGPPLVIEAEYVTDVSETQFLSGQLGQNNGAAVLGLFSPITKMPQFINGVKMPSDPVSTFNQNPNFGSGVIISYSGYCTLSMSAERRGIFLVARNTYHEVQQIAQVTQGAFQ
jgi:hypothetical protein